MNSGFGDDPFAASFAKAGWGDILIGTYFATIVYGITVLQTFLYYMHHYGDPMSWQIFVGGLFLLDTTALGLSMYSMQYYLVSSWGNNEAISVEITAYGVEYILSTFIAILAQGFYINTIRALRAPLFVIFLLLGLAIVSFAAGLILPVMQLKLRVMKVIIANEVNHVAFIVSRATALACDIGIVVVLCRLLVEKKRGIPKSNAIIHTLMVFALQRGILQAVVVLGDLMSYISGISSDFLPFHVVVSRIYCTSLLATLNSRGYVARRGMLPVENRPAHPPTPLDIRDHRQREYAPSTSASRETRAILTTVISYLDPPFLGDWDIEEEAIHEWRNVMPRRSRETGNPAADNLHELEFASGSIGSTGVDVIHLEPLRKSKSGSLDKVDIALCESPTRDAVVSIAEELLWSLPPSSRDPEEPCMLPSDPR